MNREEFYKRAMHYAGVIDPAKRVVDYIDPAPKQIIAKIPLVEFFERITRHKADRWQQHFCQYLEDAATHRHEKRTEAIVHAEAQLGKSRQLAQCYPAWILGHDPEHRVALATYNVSRSQAHSKAVMDIMNLDIYKAIFPDDNARVSPSASKEKWRTEGRKKATTDAQDSFNPVGLQSGLTGSGFDTLIIDDPYADVKEAFSETVRANLINFWEFTVMSRIGEHSNVFGMFHRYHIEDLAGYLLDQGSFDYLRYASVCDGAYIHESTGQKFDDPLNREKGEYISERRGATYYADKQKDKRVWNSMFQGRPTSEEGDFFHVKKIRVIEGEELEAERAKCRAWARAWDNAATEGAGDHSAGAKIGMQSDGGVLVDDFELAQVDTAGRIALQRSTAQKDGLSVTVVIPKELAAAGKDVVFFTEEYLKGFNVQARSVITSKSSGGSTVKARRAYNFSIAVNSGQVKFAKGAWNNDVLRCMRNFLFSGFDDPIDAMADGYNFLYEQVHRGLVVSNYEPARSLINYESFKAKFEKYNHEEKDFGKVPDNFTIYAGVKLSPDASRANSAVIVARAPHVTGMSDHLFIVGEYKDWTADLYECFDWLNKTLEARCANSKKAVVWLHPDSEGYKQTIHQKLQRPVHVFEGDSFAGVTEMDWYFKPTEQANPFNELQNATRLYGLIYDQNQLAEAKDSNGLYAFRQEAATWAYNDKQEPSAVGAVLDCLRMVTYAFHTSAKRMTAEERAEAKIAAPFRLDTINAQKENMSEEEFSRALITHQVRLGTSKLFNGNGKKKTGGIGRFKR